MKTKKEQRALAVALLKNLTASIKQNINDIPEDWDGYEIRAWIGDYYQQQFVMKFPTDRRRHEYHKELYRRNLIADRRP